jgi:hypothetical protein
MRLAIKAQPGCRWGLGRHRRSVVWIAGTWRQHKFTVRAPFSSWGTPSRILLMLPHLRVKSRPQVYSITFNCQVVRTLVPVQSKMWHRQPTLGNKWEDGEFTSVTDPPGRSAIAGLILRTFTGSSPLLATI